MRRPAVLAVLTATLWTQSGSTEPADELKALTREFEALKNGQAAIQKELREIKSLLGVSPEKRPVRRPLADTREGTVVGGLDDRQRAALVGALAAQPRGTPVWFAVYDQDPASRELGRALQAAFGEAGWVVRGMRRVPFGLKPGIFLFAADEEPPAYVQTAHEALELAGLQATSASGYRSFYAEMTRTKPGWRGFEMAPEQTYLIVIGPMAQRPLAETGGGGTGGLGDRQRAALVRALAAQPAGTPVWFAVYEQDAAARELGRVLRAAFSEAGWVVRGMRAVPFAINSGVFLFAADDEPPAYAQTAQESLQLAGISSTLATGYRSYYAEMQTKPGWRGFEMAPEQTYLVVIGPMSQRP